MAQRLDRINRLLDGTARNRREITTPEGVALEVDIANHGERLVAFLIDFLFWMLATALLFLVLALTLVHGVTGSVTVTIILFLSFLLRNLYFIHFELQSQSARDFPMLSDTALQQMICNLLDNASEASPEWVQLSIATTPDHVVLHVRDRGPGFAPAVLQEFGQRHVSTKHERPGRGLGLFLVVNVARSLRGSVQVRNPSSGGAEVEVRLPYSAIAL